MFVFGNSPQGMTIDYSIIEPNVPAHEQEIISKREKLIVHQIKYYGKIKQNR
jgi:hypothetical protein